MHRSTFSLLFKGEMRKKGKACHRRSSKNFQIDRRKADSNLGSRKTIVSNTSRSNALGPHSSKKRTQERTKKRQRAQDLQERKKANHLLSSKLAQIDLERHCHSQLASQLASWDLLKSQLNNLVKETSVERTHPELTHTLHQGSVLA